MALTREADIWYYLHYKVSHGQRFVVCAAQNRRLEEAPGKLFELPEVLASEGSHTLNVMQQGGRAARQARMFISYSEVSIKNPDNSGLALLLTYVCCREQAEDGACWHLLKSEKVASAADARHIVSHYERRWLTEEYHKAWKSGGTCVESLRMQTRDNLERMVVIKAFIAVRVLGLLQEGISEETQNDSCKKILTPTEWKLLWVKLEGKPLPSQTPTLKWACLKLAKLGRWHDSKRTGRPGWVVMWDGWFRLQDMVEGYLVMRSLDRAI